MSEFLQGAALGRQIVGSAFDRRDESRQRAKNEDRARLTTIKSLLDNAKTEEERTEIHNTMLVPHGKKMGMDIPPTQNANKATAKIVDEVIRLYDDMEDAMSKGELSPEQKRVFRNREIRIEMKAKRADESLYNGIMGIKKQRGIDISNQRRGRAQEIVREKNSLEFMNKPEEERNALNQELALLQKQDRNIGSDTKVTLGNILASDRIRESRKEAEVPQVDNSIQGKINNVANMLKEIKGTKTYNIERRIAIQRAFADEGIEGEELALVIEEIDRIVNEGDEDTGQPEEQFERKPSVRPRSEPFNIAKDWLRVLMLGS